MRSISVVLMICVMCLFTTATRAQELWVGKDGNIRNVDTRSMVIAGGEMYLATRNELYRSAGQKDRWEPVFSLPSGDNEIQCVTGRGAEMLIGTKKGVFGSQDSGKTWRNIFKAITPEKNDILSMDISRRGSIVLGTGKGAFSSDDNGAKWKDAGGLLKNSRVACVACGNGVIYAGTDEGVFVKREAASDWERVYVKSKAGENAEEVETADAEVEEGEEALETCLALKGTRLYIGSGRKISYSDDLGKSWIAFSAAGFTGNISCILPSKSSDKLYCATTKGVFEFSAEKKIWLELYRGADKIFNVRSIVFDKEDEKDLWAATAKGLYRFESGRFIAEEYIDIEKAREATAIIFDGEPTFKDLQRAAMEFAEVDPEKIKKWRTQARLSALVPKISVGFDNSKSNTYEIYTSATKDYVVAGPDDINEGFDVSVSWDLANMIWSTDQTSIDVRSRLTTQLRNDILDDLRRAYYERKRLQYESIVAPPKDTRLRFEKELRIQELAQVINDLTGNYLSEHMRKPDKNL